MWAEGGRLPAGADSLYAVKGCQQEAAGIGGCAPGARVAEPEIVSHLALCQTVERSARPWSAQETRGSRPGY